MKHHVVHAADIEVLHINLHNLPRAECGIGKDPGNDADAQIFTDSLDDHVRIGAGPQRSGG